MARVYRAEDVVLGRTVAIKMMRSESDGAEVAPRARTEMALLASLNHPSLVTLYDAHVVPGEPEYLVMEYVEGTTLANELAEHPMDAGDVAALATELASALHVVHAAGIVHRDVKPSNVLLATDPLPERRHRAKLADFGIAYLAEADRLTSPGVVIGTAAYLAPEQVRGEFATPAADIYALGLVLLEALTGTRAFPQASGIGAVMARLVETPDVPSWMGWEWATLLQTMTASDPAQRPTALDVVRAAAALPTDVRRPEGSAAVVDVPTVATPVPPVASAAVAPLVPTPPPLPPISADVAARSGATLALPTPTTRRSHRALATGSSRAPRAKMRTRTKILIGSALAVAAILGTNAATWVGSVPGGPPLVEPTTTEPATPTDTDADAGLVEEPEVVAVSEEADADSRTGSGTKSTGKGATADKGEKAAGAKGKDKAAKAAAKAARDAAKDAAREDRKAKKAEKDRERRERKAEHQARKEAERAAREGGVDTQLAGG